MTNKQRIIKILNEYSITFWTEGKNVSEDSINVCCPYCNDHSNHCGIFIDSLIFHCWRCSTKGSFTNLLQTLTGLSVKECNRIVGSSNIDFKISSKEQIESKFSKSVHADSNVEIVEIEFPEYAVPITKNTGSVLLDRYLTRRNIELNTLISNNCHLCEVGRYMHRMIIPIYYQGVLVSYQAADLTGKADIKYDTAKGDINNFLYNYDNLTQASALILVEGILDAWRLSPNGKPVQYGGETYCVCATFGTHITTAQKALIEDKKLNSLLFCWDFETYWKAKKQSRHFEPYINEVQVIKLPAGEDPDSFGKTNTFQLF